MVPVCAPCVFIKQPKLILTERLADEVYWRLQDFCGLFSWFVLHSCASPSSERCQLRLPVPAGADRAAIMCAARARLQPCSSGHALEGFPTRKHDREVLSYLLGACHNNLQFSRKTPSVGFTFYLNVVSLKARLSHQCGAKPKTRPSSSPLVKHFVTDPCRKQIPGAVHSRTKPQVHRIHHCTCLHL